MVVTAGDYLLFCAVSSIMYNAVLLTIMIEYLM